MRGRAEGKGVEGWGTGRGDGETDANGENGEA